MNTENRPNKVEVPVNKNYSHDLSHHHVTTLDFFRLQPVLCQEVIPGGTYPIDLRAVIQSAPLATQVFGGCHLDLHAFFVPNRIVFENWNQYYNGDSRTTGQQYSLPQVSMHLLQNRFGYNSTTGAVSSEDEDKERRRVFSSLGYPAYTKYSWSTTFPISLLQARAYQQIWWDYYRDSVNIPESAKGYYLNTKGGIFDSNTSVINNTFDVRYRTFKKDFISTLLSSPQMGNPSVIDVNTYTPATGSKIIRTIGVADDGTVVSYGGKANQTIYGTLDKSVSVAVLRGATAMQRYLERLNVTGSRPMERLLSLLGVKPSAERLDMAEFLGGKTIKVNINGLVNTGSNEQVSSSTSNGNKNAWGISNASGEFGNHFGQGYQSGYAVGSGQSDVIRYSPTEHGHIIVIASLIPEYMNPNQLQRQFIRGLATPDSNKFDFFTPDMDGLGYQEMLLSEVCMPNAADLLFTSSDDYEDGSSWSTDYNPFNVVGYQPKYEDYRYVADRLSGDFLDHDSSIAMRNLVFSLTFPEIMSPLDVQAGINLTTSDFSYRALFDKHFQISSPNLDHFVVSMYVQNKASLPVTNNQLPTELSDLANSELLDVSNGGVRM